MKNYEFIFFLVGIIIFILKGLLYFDNVDYGLRSIGLTIGVFIFWKYRLTHRSKRDTVSIMLNYLSIILPFILISIFDSVSNCLWEITFFSYHTILLLPNTTLTSLLASTFIIKRVGWILWASWENPFPQLVSEFTEIFLGFTWLLFLSEQRFIALKQEYAMQKEDLGVIVKLQKKSAQNSIKTKFIAIITHEIRNFLCNLISNIQVLQESRTWDQEIISELAQNANCMRGILNDTLDISKLEEGKIEFHKNFESIPKLISMIIKMTKTTAESKEIEVNAVHSPFLPVSIEIDRTRVTQIILNILNNALKFTAKKGKVTITVSWAMSCGHCGGDCSLCDGRLQKESQLQLGHIQEERKGRIKMSEKINSHFSIFEEEKKTLISLPKQPIQKNEETSDIPQEESDEENNFALIQTSKINNKIKHYSFFQDPSYNNKLMYLKNPISRKDLREENKEPPRIIKYESLHSSFPNRVPSSRLKNKKDEIWEMMARFNISRNKNELTRTDNGNGKRNRKVQPRKTYEKNSCGSDDNLRRHSSQVVRSTSNCSFEESTPSNQFCNYLMEMPPEGVLRVAITDTGCGMSTADMNNIFQPFSQANKTVHEHYGGTGLGLWLSKRLATAMSGNITCESVLGKGTTFQITIPAKCKSQRVQSSRNTVSLCKGVMAYCLKRNTTDIMQSLEEIKCCYVEVHTIPELLRKVSDHKKQNVQIQVVFTGMKYGRMLLEMSKESDFPIKSLQVVLLTQKLIEDNNQFQYILKRPISNYILVSILAHIIKGKQLQSAAIEDIRRSSSLNLIHRRYDQVRVLIADDNEFVRKAHVRLLKHFTDCVSQCCDGRQLVEEYRMHHSELNLLIIDKNMPVLDGISAIKAIRAMEKSMKFSPVKIVLLTGENNLNMNKSALQSLNIEKLLKPIHLEQIEKIFESATLISRPQPLQQVRDSPHRLSTFFKPSDSKL